MSAAAAERISTSASAEEQFRALADAIAFTRVAQMLDHCVVADSQNPGDFPVRFPARRPDHALTLAISELHGLLSKANALHSPCRLECKGANELKKWQVFDSQSLARASSERAGAVRIAGNVGGNREAFPDPVGSSKFEDPMIIRGQRNHARKFRPGEADSCEVARPMDRVEPAQRLLIEPVRPVFRIIVDPDRRITSSHVDMMGQREIGEAEIARDIPQCVGELDFAAQFPNIPDKGLYTIEHPWLRLRSGTCSKSRQTAAPLLMSASRPPLT